MLLLPLPQVHLPLLPLLQLLPLLLLLLLILSLLKTNLIKTGKIVAELLVKEWQHAHLVVLVSLH